MTQVVDDSLEAGREAARRHAWRDAYDLLQKADERDALTAEHGHVALMGGTTSIDLGELERAGESFRKARELGQRFGERSLVAWR